jgi:hypothetical protein
MDDKAHRCLGGGQKENIMKIRQQGSGFGSRLYLLFLGCLLLSAGSSQAGVIDFDSLSPGDPVNVIDDVTFSSNTGLQLIASNRFDAASGDNYLGVDDGLSEAFLPFFGDLVTLEFGTGINSLSVSFISTPGAPTGTYSVTTALGSAVSSALPDATLADGGEVFRVVFSSLTPFDIVELSGGTDGAHSFNIDDIEFATAQTVPAPGTLGLIVVALFAAAARRPRG